MLPVYRPHDKKANAKLLNEKTFEDCTNRILTGGVISLFPEGNHLNRKKLRPIKSGILKVIGRAIDAAEDGQEIKIIPVGIDYSNYTRFREDILISFGEPIIANEYVEKGNTQDNSANSNLRVAIENGIKNEMIHIENNDVYDCLFNSRELISSISLDKDPYSTKTEIKFDAYQKAVNLICENLKENTSKTSDLNQAYSEYSELIKKEDLHEQGLIDFTANRKTSLIHKLLLILGYPVFFVGYLINMIPMIFTEGFVKKNIKDPHFISSIRIAVGAGSYFIYYLLVTALCLIVWGLPITLATLLVMIAGANFSLHYSDYRIRIKNISKVQKLNADTRNEILSKREKLISLIQEFNTSGNHV